MVALSLKSLAFCSLEGWPSLERTGSPSPEAVGFLVSALAFKEQQAGEKKKKKNKKPFPVLLSLQCTLPGPAGPWPPYPHPPGTGLTIPMKRPSVETGILSAMLFGPNRSSE